MSPNTKVNSNINIIFYPSNYVWHRLFLTGDISAAALVHMWQLVEQAKSSSIAFIPILFNCKNIKGIGTCVIVWLPLIGSVPP